MSFIFLLPVAVFLGLGVGIFTGYAAKEELRQNSFYIELFRKLMLFSIVILAVFSLFLYEERNLAILEIAAGVILIFLLEKKKARMDYIFLGFMLAAAIYLFKNVPCLMLFSVVMFLYGIPYGSQLFENKKLKWKPIARHAMMFFAPFVILLAGGWSVLFLGTAAICLLFRFRN